MSEPAADLPPAPAACFHSPRGRVKMKFGASFSPRKGTTT